MGKGDQEAITRMAQRLKEKAFCKRAEKQCPGRSQGKPRAGLAERAAGKGERRLGVGELIHRGTVPPEGHQEDWERSQQKDAAQNHSG